MVLYYDTVKGESKMDNTEFYNRLMENKPIIENDQRQGRRFGACKKGYGED